VLSHIVERTRLDDFVVIVNEGRFKEKKVILNFFFILFILQKKKLN